MMKVRMAVMLAVLIVVSAALVYACDYQATCPMHNLRSNATGQTKRTDGGQHEWAEYQCPGIQNEAPHTFWADCK
jgi:hypothetical protein